MCSRYTLSSPQEVLDELGVTSFGFEPTPRYNIAPTQEAPVVLVREGKRVAELHKFGLIPSWAKDPRMGVRLLNARSETAAKKPAFRDAMAKRRCLVATDGFLEWKREGKLKLPHWFRNPSARALALAGLWERWKSPEGWVLSFSILTAPANDQVAELHDRMPVIIDREDHQRWLEPELGADEDRARSPDQQRQERRRRLSQAGLEANRSLLRCRGLLDSSLTDRAPSLPCAVTTSQEGAGLLEILVEHNYATTVSLTRPTGCAVD